MAGSEALLMSGDSSGTLNLPLRSRGTQMLGMTGKGRLHCPEPHTCLWEPRANRIANLASGQCQRWSPALTGYIRQPGHTSLHKRFSYGRGHECNAGLPGQSERRESRPAGRSAGLRLFALVPLQSPPTQKSPKPGPY